MKKGLPKLKKTVKSFMVEEDAKLINKNASKIALSTAFISSITLLNIETGNAAPWDHSEHENHSNDLDLPSPSNPSATFLSTSSFTPDTIIEYPSLLNLGEDPDNIDYEYEQNLDVTISHSETTTSEVEGRGTTRSVSTYDPHFKFSVTSNNYEADLLPPGSNPETISIPSKSGGGGTQPNPDYVPDETTVSESVNPAEDAYGETYTLTTQYDPGVTIDSYSLNVEIQMPESDSGLIQVTIDGETKEVEVPQDSSEVINFNSQKNIDVSSRTPEKSVSAVHSNHFNHSDGDGWF